MTKLEEQELYYENILDKLCSMNEAEQQAYLSRMTEADAARVMKAMVRKVSKNLAKSKKGLNKIKTKITKAPADVQNKVANSRLIGDRGDLSAALKEIELFETKYLQPTTGLWAKMVDNPYETPGAEDITKKDLKQIQTDANFAALQSGAKSTLTQPTSTETK